MTHMSARTANLANCKDQVHFSMPVSDYVSDASRSPARVSKGRE